ncbi:MAG: hypothetical protein DRQ49_04695 [Gammaproteobacteria bacterium]|nr:MAG: hypothetical protein DRQ41_10590 [Gammaproteobacteria bacterium]RKZ41557.1 MAG: hypothetical protein DRQ49_04695 [Gammaproteobacteria bacterium]RKZ76258.1 MAG: hypothetical protein DRQ57_04655 [Gammaproteobacteria bacterium]
MEIESSEPQDIRAAIDAFIQTTSLEDAIQVIEKHPSLLEDQADLLLSSIIISAHKEGHELTAQALDERRDFIRSVRQERS